MENLSTPPVERDMLLGRSHGRPLHSIISEVANKYGLTYAELISARRQRHLAWPRQEAYYRCRNETSHTFPEIGRAFGNRDHTTILHGIQQYEKRMAEKAGRVG